MGRTSLDVGVGGVMGADGEFGGVMGADGEFGGVVGVDSSCDSGVTGVDV